MSAGAPGEVKKRLADLSFRGTFRLTSTLFADARRL